MALLFRTWALTEMSDFLDLETVNSWVQSRTLEGVADYYRFTFLATNPGAAHMLPQWALFHLFGTSIFTLRMAAVLWGVAATLLMYWLVRRLAGVGRRCWRHCSSPRRRTSSSGRAARTASSRRCRCSRC